MNGEKRTSPWVYVGFGCAALLVLALLGLGAAGYFVYRKVGEIDTQMKDPQARTAEAQRLLGAKTLPEGYHAMAAFTVPLVMEMALLGDEPPGPDGQPGKKPRHLFVYLGAFTGGTDQQELRDYLDGKRDDVELLRRRGVELGKQEVLRRGALQRPDEAPVRYVVQRGEMVVQGDKRPGLTMLSAFECGDARLRMGIWTGPDPGNDALSGSLADEAVIGPFLAHFHPCGS